jgi:hypothetical protein
MISKAAPNEAPRDQVLPYRYSSFVSDVVSSADHWPTRSEAIETSLERLAAQSRGQPLIRQIAAYGIYEAIEKEKIRLVCSILSMRQQQAALRTQQPPEEPCGTLVVQKIGSHVYRKKV